MHFTLRYSARSESNLSQSGLYSVFLRERMVFVIKPSLHLIFKMTLFIKPGIRQVKELVLSASLNLCLPLNLSTSHAHIMKLEFQKTYGAKKDMM